MHPSQAPCLSNAQIVLRGRVLYVDEANLFILALWALIIQFLKGNSNAPGKFMKSLLISRGGYLYVFPDATAGG
jgi:hypothetical protein